MRSLTLLALVALTPFVAMPAVGGAVCPVDSDPAVPAGDFYVRIPPGLGSILPEFWEESNGAPGLQRSATYCEAGIVPPDTCITHADRSALIGCALAYPSTLP